MAYLHSIKFLPSSNKFSTEDKIELRADLVEYISTLGFEEAKKYLEGNFKTLGYICEVDYRFYNSVAATGRRIKQNLKGKNSKQRCKIREKWHQFRNEKEVLLVKEDLTVSFYLLCFASFFKPFFLSISVMAKRERLDVLLAYIEESST